ncbi:MAG: enoyl-CoA hydratase-related protein [Candidatus Electryoneaceae bacterium]|nr:enoyl-CoA hydratase-related protein [Candidatus Electryoneaceae bacterium]
MEFNNITYDVTDGIAVVTINRPKAMNSLNSETVAEISQVFDLIAADDAVLGVIVTGTGNKAFVAGADISELATKDTLTGRDFALLGQRTFSKIERLPKPVIAAVNGFALGGGCELSMACHIRTAAAHAKFGQPEVNLGLIPGFGGTQRLPRLVGKGIALELLLSANIIGAAEAYRIGLVNRVIEAYKKDSDGNDLADEKGRKIFDRDAFLEETTKMLKVMISKGPIALSYVIDAVNRGLDTDIEAGLKLEADLFGVLYAADDTSEGLNAFLEKRKANFTGK